MSNTIKWNETMELNKLFVGKSVKKVDDEHLLLSDGTKWVLRHWVLARGDTQ